MESKIGGYGVHNINKISEDGVITGNYAERSVYRGLQYCAGQQLIARYIDLDPRSLVIDACSHIEGLVAILYEHVCRVDRDRREPPLGKLISILLENKDELQTELEASVRKGYDINKALILSKHNYQFISPSYINQDPLRMDSHIFSFDEAMVVYFSCRIYGMELSSIMHTRYGIPKSLDKVKSIPRDMFNSIAKDLSYNLRNWADENILKGIKRTEEYILKRRAEL